MKNAKPENLCQCYLANKQLHQFLEEVDWDLTRGVQQGGCLLCGGRLDRSDYGRKPRGGPEQWDERLSLCCATHGCRKRHTPPSVRFLGRKVYVGIVVILVSAMRHGLNPGAARILGQSLGIDRRTLERWKTWWQEIFALSEFWKAVRARFAPPICNQTLPLSLCEAFDIERRDRLLELLKFLAPITTTSVPLEHLI
jgi:hypothetical protein